MGRYLYEEIERLRSHLFPIQIKPDDEIENEFIQAMDLHMPYLAGKIGMSELYALRTIEYAYHKKRELAFEQLKKWSGFFPLTENEEQFFYDCYINAIRNTNALFQWQTEHQYHFLKKYGSPQLKVTNIETVIGGHLLRFCQGKKVLVIHPFAKTIESQYLKREHLNEGGFQLPEFELLTQKALQTIGGNEDYGVKSWSEGLDLMANAALKQHFDVAFISCGCYALPLGSILKDAGKVAIHGGGALQLFFGIMGKRWEGTVQTNEYWVRPSKEETPEQAKNVEDACYW